MKEYKLKYELLNATTCVVTDWMSFKKAKIRFDRMHDDINNKVVWCELIECDWSGDDDNTYVIESFEREKINIFGITLLVPSKN